MRSTWLAAGIASLVAACATPTSSTESESELRQHLQAAHDATLLLHLHVRLDAAALARGVRQVRAWTDEADWVVDGSTDASGTISIALPTIDVHDRCLTTVHIVDRAGVHWYSCLDLTTAPPIGRHDLGELQLQREPDEVLVVDDRGRPVEGACILLLQQYPEEHPGLTGGRDFETRTNAHGRASLCRAAPFESSPPLVVRHADFAPWWGTLTSRIELDHGGEIRGRVVVPPGADAADFAVGVWVDEAAIRNIQGDAGFANVTAPIAPDGSYRLRNVPHGTRTVCVQDRNPANARGESLRVEVGPTPVTAPELTIDPAREPRIAMRFRIVGHDGKPAIAPAAVLWPSDAGVSVPLHNGYFDWVAQDDEDFEILVPGYGRTERRTYRSGEVLRLRGGHRVAVRLAIDAARHLPAGCAVRAILSRFDDGRDHGLGIQLPVLYADDDENLGYTALSIARDANLVVEPGRYGIDLELLRWDASEANFVDVPIDVEPREFEVRAGSEPTLVTISSRFVEQPKT